MKKTLNVIRNPRLDKIFSEAYRNTMRDVALREEDKHNADYHQIFSELFEKDLYNHDLTSEERAEFMEVFHREIVTLRKSDEENRRKRRRFMFIGGSSLAGILLLSFGLWVAAARPFMPVSKIITQLDYYLEKVDDGYGSYANKFYRLVDQQGRKLPGGAEVGYRDAMYDSLDGHFDETIASLESGEVRYYDDAKKWASRFPEAEERKDRKELADNAFKKGLGAAVGETLDDVKEGAKNLLERAGDFIKDVVGREE